MLESNTEGVRQALEQKTTKGSGQAPGGVRPSKTRLRGLDVGRHIVYAGSGVRRVRVGQVTNISRAEQAVTVHRWSAAVDGRLRIVWTPLYVSAPDGQVTGQTSLETFSVDSIVMVVELNRG
eukprot:12912753-Heterocapsa_arctica.AAC.1